MEPQVKHFQDLRQMPVQDKPCRTCPFAGKEPIPLEPSRYAQYLMPLVKGSSQHLCHSANDQKVCRGAREIQLRILYLKGAIEAPTDEAFNKAITQELFPHELEIESEQ
ncbi:hypothetical protein [Laspinema olomoucense]|uniref:hypothetical protein n=1 Tax=Laspinema olomoucense TaxID=3231600 RepID=UPI0021BB5F4A|nr:hypothetical protein [Laspinema sp. D3c]MCT7992421.1 hypothetical protein [Laspinema sp. D3c]